MLDDVHWADDASLELIAHLLRRPPPGPVLIALAFRAGQVPNSLLAALDQAGRDGMVSEVALGPLTQSEAEALLGAPQPLLYRRAAATRSTSRSSRARPRPRPAMRPRTAMRSASRPPSRPRSGRRSAG